jgi:hypothetical protein
LARYKDQQPVILALPRGGVPVAVEVAEALQAPLDLILVRKIGVPSQPELAMGAVVDGEAPVVVRNADVIRLAGIDEADFKAVCDAELSRSSAGERYLGNRRRAGIAGRTAIVIDDGIATERPLGRPCAPPCAQPEEDCSRGAGGADRNPGCSTQRGRRSYALNAMTPLGDRFTIQISGRLPTVIAALARFAPGAIKERLACCDQRDCCGRARL